MFRILLCRCVSNLFAMPWAAGIVLLAGFGSLVTAFTAQYVFDVAPCELCWWQRGPYALAILLGGLALVFQANAKAAKIFLALASFVFLVGMGLAIYHTGVEQHWWADGSACALTPITEKSLSELSIADLRNQLLGATAVPCDEITWTFLGFSMANWNILFSLGLAVFAALAASGLVREGKPCRCCRSRR